MFKAIFGAGIISAALVFAPPAQARTGVCGYFDQYPTTSGVLQLVIAGMESGLTSEQVADKVVGDVASGCPEYIPLLKQFVNEMKGTNVYS